VNRSLATYLVRLYPPRWRERYGNEFEELLEHERAHLGTVLDVVRAASWQHALSLCTTGEAHMETYPASVITMARKPSAFIPVLMSLCALAVVIGSVTAFGTDALRRMPDEGAAAHIWQLLMAGQLPILGFFAFKWLARDRKAALSVLALQLIGFGLALLPVWLLGL
jgi:hypothetical protein